MSQAYELRDGIKLKDLRRVKRAVTNGANVNAALPGYSFNSLYLAIDVQNIDAVEYLIENGCEVNYEDSWYNCHTPLTFAIHKNSLEIVKLLVSKGADVNRVHSDGDTPLSQAVRLNKLQIVEFLLKQKADINQVGWKEKTPLAWAITKNNLEAVKILIANGAGKNKALELTKKSKNSEILEFLQSRESTERRKKPTRAIAPIPAPSINESCVSDSNKSGNTPLINAIQTEKVEVVQQLLTSGVDACKAGANGKTPLIVAVQKKNLEIIKLLLNHGAEHTIQTALLEAISLEQLSIIKLLLQEASVNVIYKNGYTPLTKAIETGNFEIVQILVDNGANINMPDRDGNLPLALAVKKGNSDIVKYLINNAIPSDAILEKCYFLLKYIEEDNFEMVQLLVDLGAKLDVIFDSGNSSLTKAVQMDNFRIVKYLIENKADVNLADNNGRVPVAIAATNQNLRIVKFLIGEGADTSLAKEEIDKYASCCEDFAIYLDLTMGKYKKWDSRISLCESETFIKEEEIVKDKEVRFILHHQDHEEEDSK